MHKDRIFAPGADGQERARSQNIANEYEEKVSTQLPPIDCWQGLSAQDREYRSIKLLELERRIQADGSHQAQPNAQRARQFMPFAALKGYDELAHSKERWEE